MKITAIVILSFLTMYSCSKREIDTTPNQETTKMGGDAGTGSTGSLGSSNPGSETGAPVAPVEH